MTPDEIEKAAIANGHPPVADKVVLLDFDATVAPWGDLFGFPAPLPGAKEFVDKLKAAGYTVVLFTSRLSTVWHAHEGRDPARGIFEQVEYLRKYCEKYSIDVDSVTGEKIPGEVYYDDKAQQFIGWDKALMPDSKFAQVDVAWAAGFFDGEGSVGVYRSRRGNLDNNGSGRYGSLTVSISQIVKEPLQNVMKMFGGSIYGSPHRNISQWRLSGAPARDFLRIVSPYLTVKAEQARLGIEFQSLVRDRNEGFHAPLSQGEMDKRVLLIDAIKEAKKHG